MTSPWTLRDANGIEKTLADWGLREVTRERINQSPDVVTFRADGARSDADPLFAHGSTVRLFRNGAPWFYGRVVQVPGRASAKAEEQLYRVAGPWWHLENLVFQQIWQTTNGVDATLVPTAKSRLILGQKNDGTKLATGAAIAEVLAYAVARGVPLAVGEITPDAITPYEEALDLSCAEVIRRLLRWSPDATAVFDYSTAPLPTLSIFRRAEAPLISLPAYGSPVSALDLTPRHDLQVPAVVLKFEQTHDIDHDTFTSVTTQSAPPTATGDEFGALVMTLDLAGARATYQKQKVRTGLIPSSESSPGVIGWWKEKFAWLRDFDDADLGIVDGSHTRTIEHPELYPDVTLANVPSELLEGSVAAWMDLAAAPLLVQATFQYAGADSDEVAEVWGAKKQRVLFTRVIGTNAQTQTYSRLTSATEAESIPAGLADAIHAAAGTLQYDGALELTEAECSGFGAPGSLLNLTGGRTEWTTMRAQIQRVEEELDTGRTRLVVGPAKHLGHEALASLLRVNRSRRLSFRLAERTSGQASGNAAKVQGGEQQPRSDSLFRPSAGGESTPNAPFQLIDASDASGLKVKVNANSFLQQTLTLDDTFAIAGLNTVMAVAPGTRVWLEIEVESYAPTSAAIVAGSSAWDEFPNPFTYTGDEPDQVLTKVHLLIGYVADAGSTLDGRVITGGPADAPVSAKIVQCVSHHLLLQNVVFNGLPAVYPFAHHAPYVA